MSGPPKPFRFRRRVPSIIALFVWVFLLQSPALSQSDAPTTLEQPKKLTLVFSPVEIRPIRVNQPPPESQLSSESHARQNDIEQRALARIFAGGMIVDHSVTSLSPATNLAIGGNATIADSAPLMVVAQVPEQSGTSPQESIKTTQPRMIQDGEVIISDILLESSTLPEPPLVGDRVEESLKSGVPQRAEEIPRSGNMFPTLRDAEPLRGMIEDDCPRPIVIDDLQDFATESNAETQVIGPGQRQLPDYKMPDGGLDIYMLAPTRFSRPLPNAR
jgi:hypothetical protein